MKIGVLAIQGDFEAHKKRLEELGAEVVLVPKPEQFDEIEARRKELEERSCVFQLLREALKSSDPEVRARAKDAVRPPPSPLDEAIFSLED